MLKKFQIEINLKYFIYQSIYLLFLKSKSIIWIYILYNIKNNLINNLNLKNDFFIYYILLFIIN